MFNFLKNDFKIVEKYKTWFGISLSIIFLGIIFFTIYAIVGGSFSKGLNLGIDFTGGTQLDITIGSAMTDDNADEIRKTILDTLHEHNITDYNQIQRTDVGFLIVYRTEASELQEKTSLVLNGVTVGGEYSTPPTLSLKGRLIETIHGVQVKTKSFENSFGLIRVDPKTVTAKASDSILLSALLAVSVASVLMLIYIAIRFEISSGVATILALLHDILIMTAVMIIFNIQINSIYMAALITIIAYLINATIVIFDHIRENSKKVSMQDKSAAYLVNNSIKKTLSRTINTTVTTLFTVVMLFILGVSEIREFAFPIIVGLLAGAYSSTFLVGSGWAVFKDKQTKKYGKRDFFARKLFRKREKFTEVKNETE